MTTTKEEEEVVVEDEWREVRGAMNGRGAHDPHKEMKWMYGWHKPERSEWIRFAEWETLCW